MRRWGWPAGCRRPIVWWAVVLYIFSATAILRVHAQATRSSNNVNGYVDQKVCADCHQGVWEAYRRTGMGRSFFRPNLQNMVEDFTNRNTFYHQASETYFTMTRRDGRYFQSQYQVDFDGKRTNVSEKEIDFIVGSGNHSRTYLHRTARNTLIELPLAWYAEKGGYWAMNPGYDRPDHQGFRRVIGYDCMFCHNAYPESPADSGETGSDPVFTNLREGIDCQRCHGPGGRHVQAARNPGARKEDVRSAIVNPALLAPDRQMDVCMQCHLETTSFPLPNSMVRYERAPFSYQPGEPLADFVLHFDQAPGKGNNDKFEIAGAAYRMRRSACFQKSNNALRCTTCHNPHDVQRGVEAAKHYTAVCRQCHGAPLDGLIAAGQHPRSADCVGCHMPKRRTDDVVHVVMTDHYIQRRKPERDLLADIAERPMTDSTAYHGEVVLYYPQAPPKPEDELYVAVAQVIQSSNLTEGIGRLSAAIQKFRPEKAVYYLRLADALRSAGRVDQALLMYAEALRREPKSLAVLQSMAVCLMSARQPSRAAEILKQGLESAPGDATTWHLLGTAYVEVGRTSDAIAAFQKAIELDPELPEGYNSLGGLWFEAGDVAKAEPSLRDAIRLEPNYAEAHNNLANVLSSAGRFEEARYHFEAALRSQPNDTGARYDYAMALAHARRLDDAQAQLEALLRIRPNASDAHEFLGTVLAAEGQLDRAIEHYREAIRIQPEFSRAHLHLGEALADSGHAAEAVLDLRKAAVSSDPAIRDEAFKALEKIEKGR